MYLICWQKLKNDIVIGVRLKSHIVISKLNEATKATHQSKLPDTFPLLAFVIFAVSIGSRDWKEQDIRAYTKLQT